MSDPELALKSINTIRTLCIDAIQKANSGHPGLPLGAAPMVYVLWQRHLRHNPRSPGWHDRDRFVLSAGHGSSLLYALLHLTGYDLSLDDLREFRQWESKTPGHPEVFMTPGVEATTGPLGQGGANAVGMAMAERFLAHRFNKPGHTIVDHNTYAFVSDGDLMEGLNAEAASLAGHLELGKLIYLYDANDVTLDGPASLCFDTEDVGRRYEAYGWQVLLVEDGDTDLDAIDRAITEAKADTARPSLIIVKTTIGYGSPNKAGTSSCHGSPLGDEEVALTKERLGWNPEHSFHVPDEVKEHLGSAVARGADLQASWQAGFEAYEAAHADLARDWKLACGGDLPEGWANELPTWSWGNGEAIATRAAAGKALNALAEKIPWLFGGDADLGCSTKTLLAGAEDFEGQGGTGRNIRFGVREHAMAAICNGLDYHGGIRPYAATFFVFCDYMRPSVRLATLNGQPVIYVWTHDSIAVGEDGPTHQPVEQLMSLRSMLNLSVVRPSDGNEAAEAWRYALERTDGPTALVLSRQKLPVLDRDRLAPASHLHKGAYVLAEAGDGSGGEAAIDAIIIATGSEVATALEARESLAADGVAARVVAMPCWEAFEAQDQAYRDAVLPPAVTARISVEAGVTFGWQRWTGLRGASVGVNRFGTSAPGNVILERYGITAANVAARVKEVLG